MKWMDPSIELVACGYDLGSDWNYEVARVLKPLISHIAIHHYSIGYDIFKEEDYNQCMYIPDYLTKLTNVAKASIVAGTNDALTDIKVAWDEWNTHAWNFEKDKNDCNYTLKNTILTAGILHSFIRSSDVVEIASYSPFVNVCGAIATDAEGVLKRAQYYVFELFSKVFRQCDGYVETHMEGETYSLPEVIDYSNRKAEAKFALDAKSAQRIVKTNYIDCVAAINDNHSRMSISLINKNSEDGYEVELSVLGSKVQWNTGKCYQIYHDDFEAYNTRENPENVSVKEAEGILNGQNIHLNPHSITVIVVELEK